VTWLSRAQICIVTHSPGFRRQREGVLGEASARPHPPGCLARTITAPWPLRPRTYCRLTDRSPTITAAASHRHADGPAVSVSYCTCGHDPTRPPTPTSLGATRVGQLAQISRFWARVSRIVTVSICSLRCAAGRCGPGSLRYNTFTWSSVNAGSWSCSCASGEGGADGRPGELGAYGLGCADP